MDQATDTFVVPDVGTRGHEEALVRALQTLLAMAIPDEDVDNLLEQIPGRWSILDIQSNPRCPPFQDS